MPADPHTSLPELQPPQSDGDLWIFGYGSLMWRPDFPFTERRRAILPGRRRALCVYSVHHRGTPDKPGLVFGLDRGGACEGVAYRVAAANVRPVIAYLRAREMVTGIYHERRLPVLLHTKDHLQVRALCYEVDARHPQYACRLSDEQIIAIVRDSRGLSGDNIDYVLSTATHLEELSIRDRALERLAARLKGCHGHPPARPARGPDGMPRRPRLVRPSFDKVHLNRFVHRRRLGMG